MKNVSQSTDLPPRGELNHLDLVLQHVQCELRNLLQEQAVIQKRIAVTKRTILGLSAVFGENVLPAELAGSVDGSAQQRCRGLTDQCRRILMESGHTYSAQQLCQQLRTRDPLLLTRHKQPLASVTTILHRLKNYGEVAASSNSDGQRVWEWVASQEPPPEVQRDEVR